MSEQGEDTTIRRRGAVESLAGHAIINCVQEFAARDGWHLFGRYA